MPDGVEGDGGLGHEGPARLGGDGGGDAGGGHGVVDRLAPLGDGRGVLALDVGHAETAARARARAARGAATNGARTSTASSKNRASNTCDPMWAWRPTRSTAGEAAARCTACSARPLASPNPNLESSCPVRTNSWVWASTPGVMRRRAFGTGRPSATRASSRSSSSKESTTTRPMPSDRARRSSSVLLLLPCSTRRSAGTPAARATWYSPPVDTSRLQPSSAASRAMAVQRKALVA